VDGIVRDVTDRRGAETELSLFRRAVEASGHSVYFTDRYGTIEYVNEAFEATTGFSADEAVGQTPRILKSGEHDRRFYEALWDTILSGDVWRDEVVNRTKDGNRYVVDQTIAPVEGPTGDIERFVAVNVDITERKRREETLEQFRSAVEHAGHAVLITDTDGTIEYVNGAFERISGYSAAEAIGETPSLLKSGEHDREFYRDLWRTIEAGEIWRGEVINERKNGEQYVIDQTIAPITDGGETTGYVGINRDITELKEYKKTLEEQNERLKQYGHSVAHDLRNPLTLLKGELEDFEYVAETEGVDVELVRDRCQDVREIVDRMELLIEDLLTMAEQGQQVLEFEPVSLGSVADEAWEQVPTGEADLQTTDALVEADADRLRELLSNLFRNSIEHGRPAGETEPADGSAADFVVRVGPLDFVEGFFVEDNGTGIPPEKREQVLERGFTTENQGTGFGLAIVEQIANAHGWSVAVTEGNDGGARFEFRPETV
jgi:PAS domain S-box-containing protein